jgi:hypothetical protein
VSQKHMQRPILSECAYACVRVCVCVCMCVCVCALA